MRVMIKYEYEKKIAILTNYRIKLRSQIMIYLLKKQISKK